MANCQHKMLRGHSTYLCGEDLLTQWDKLIVVSGVILRDAFSKTSSRLIPRQRHGYVSPSVIQTDQRSGSLARFGTGLDVPQSLKNK